MPTYDYECGGCGHRFELFQSITENPVRKCPECGALKAKRLIGTGGAIIFKGSGFYTTDYRSDEYKKQASADKPKTESSSSTDGDGGGKTAGKKTTGKNDSD